MSLIVKAASKENLWISKYMLSKTEKFRRGSQGNHSTATDSHRYSIYKGSYEFYFAALKPLGSRTQKT